MASIGWGSAPLYTFVGINHLESQREIFRDWNRISNIYVTDEAWPAHIHTKYYTAVRGIGSSAPPSLLRQIVTPALLIRVCPSSTKIVAGSTTSVPCNVHDIVNICIEYNERLKYIYMLV